MVTGVAMWRRAVCVLTAAAGALAGSVAAGGPGLLLPPPSSPLLLLPSMTYRVHAAPAPAQADATERVLWNFTTAADVSEWKESSDGTAREAGMSTGTFHLQRTARFQRTVMFSLINPQPSGAGFVGFFTVGQWDLSGFSNITLQARAQGEATRYKFYMKHHGDNPGGSGGAYEGYFEMPKDELVTVEVPLDSFAYYYRGKLVPDAPSLDLTDITFIGLQVYGGVYRPEKQSGVSSLEIDWITVTA